MNTMNIKNTINNPKNSEYNRHIEESKALANKDTAPTFAKSKASNVYKDLSFGAEWKSVFFFAVAGEYFISACSFTTVALVVCTVLNYNLPLFIAATVGLALAALLEVVKVISQEKAFKFLFMYKTKPAILWVILVLAAGSSAYLSVLGANKLSSSPIVNKVYSATKSAKESEAINNHIADIEATNILIKQQSNQIANTSSNSTKKALTKTLDKLTEQKGKAIQAMEAEKEKQAIEAEGGKKEDKGRASLFGWIMVALEALLIALKCFTAFYLFRVSIDNGNQKTSADKQEKPQGSAITPFTPPSTRVPKHNETTLPHVAPRVKIGFNTSKGGGDQKEASTRVPKRDNGSDEDKGTVSCALEECGNEFPPYPKNKEYCCTECRKLAYQKRRHHKNVNG